MMVFLAYPCGCGGGCGCTLLLLGVGANEGAEFMDSAMCLNALVLTGDTNEPMLASATSSLSGNGLLGGLGDFFLTREVLRRGCNSNPSSSESSSESDSSPSFWPPTPLPRPRSVLSLPSVLLPCSRAPQFSSGWLSSPALAPFLFLVSVLGPGYSPLEMACSSHR